MREAEFALSRTRDARWQELSNVGVQPGDADTDTEYGDLSRRLTSLYLYGFQPTSGIKKAVSTVTGKIKRKLKGTP